MGGRCLCENRRGQRGGGENEGSGRRRADEMQGGGGEVSEDANGGFGGLYVTGDDALRLQAGSMVQPVCVDDFFPFLGAQSPSPKKQAVSL